MFIAIGWGPPAEDCHLQKNDEFITREGIRQNFSKSELVAIFHDYTGCYSRCLNLWFNPYLLLYYFLGTTFVYSEQL